MKLILLCAPLLALQLNASNGQEAVTEYQRKSGALVFLDCADRMIGMEIPGYGNGFERSIVIDNSMKQWFDASKPFSKNERIALDVAFYEAPERLMGLKSFPNLEWIIYKGGHFWPPDPVKSRSNEEGRISLVIDEIKGLADLQGLLIYDATLPRGGLEEIVSMSQLKAIALIGCELKTNTGYARLPDMKMIRTQEHEEMIVTIGDRTIKD